MAKILVVDDSRVDRMLLVRPLAKAGHEVTEAEDGQDAILALQNSEFALVISDVEMPILDGLGLLEWQNEYRPETPMLCVSSNERFELPCRELGAIGFLTKPTSIESVMEYIGREVPIIVNKG